jgi:hypothetical protein
MLAIGFLLAVPGGARDLPEWRSWPLGERFNIGVGAFRANLDTQVRAVSTGEIDPGAAITFERDLGMADAITRPMLSANWRVAKRHTLSINYFDLDRSGDTISTVNIKFGDAEISIDLPVESYLDIETLEFAYSYSILFDRKKDLSIGLGISFQDLKSGIRSNDDGTIIQEDLDVYLPLPTLNARFQYAFTDKWIGSINLGWLAVEAELGEKEDVDGSIWNSSAAIRYKAFKNISFSLVYNVYEIDVDYNKRDLAGFVDYKYHGPVLGIDYSF